MSRVATLLMGVALAIPGLLRAGVDTAWVRRYDGPAHGDDQATRIATDSSGNVYATGRSEGTAADYDFVTIKYKPSGDTAWVRRADFGGKDIPYGLAVDAQGNVYVAGTNNDSRMVTVKYDSAGVLKWTRPFGSQGGAFDLTLDPQGNIVVCGSSYRASLDEVIIKYRPDGDTAWVRYFDYAGDEDYAWALAVGQNGDAVATGWGATATAHYDCTTVRYDSTGNRLWAVGYDGPSHGVERGMDVAIDAHNSVIVAGYGDNGYTTPYDYITIKYDSAGETLWARRYSGQTNGDDEASALALDSDGNAYVTGFSTGDTTVYDYATVKYRSSGEQRWVARYDGPGHLLDEATAIAVMPSGEILVTGYAYGGAMRRNDCTTVMYDSAGHQMWLDAYDSGGSDAGGAIAVGPDGSFCLAGRAGGDLLVIKYIQNGGVAEARGIPCTQQPTMVAEPSVFSSMTTLHYSIGNSTTMRLLVFDAEGRRVRTLVNGIVGVSAGTLAWDGRDDRGVRVPAGVYAVVLEASNKRMRVKVVMSE
ncbi:MAG: SBBP repeat-containing protein [candidate division WOR-3 bacterium]|nr:SBBP repeat-containing protein [candidate division WOR-3 bacterium]